MAIPPVDQETPPRSARDTALDRRVVRRVGTAAGVIAVSVPNGATSVVVAFDRAEPDAAYGGLATPTWNTTAWITNQTTVGCTLHLGTAPVGAQPVTLMIVREG